LLINTQVRFLTTGFHIQVVTRVSTVVIKTITKAVLAVAKFEVTGSAVQRTWFYTLALVLVIAFTSEPSLAIEFTLITGNASITLRASEGANARASFKQLIAIRIRYHANFCARASACE
jgi:hypothetical protein